MPVIIRILDPAMCCSTGVCGPSVFHAEVSELCSRIAMVAWTPPRPAPAALELAGEIAAVAPIARKGARQS